MNLTTSALQEHYLSSILPYHTKKKDELQKTANFYRPEQFIWNNPYRTSRKMYNYYHKQNDTFNMTLKPKIQSLETQDRNDRQQERISRLRNIRNQTRQKFYSRKNKRIQLQSKSKAHSSVKYYPVATHVQRQRSIEELDLNDFKPNMTQISYLKGIQTYDKNMEKIKQLVNNQLSETHKNIRNKFKERKAKNQLNGSQIKKRAFTRTDGVK